jgi:hypothetical protein
MKRESPERDGVDGKSEKEDKGRWFKRVKKRLGGNE